MKNLLIKLGAWWAKVRLPVYITFFSNHGGAILSWFWSKVLKLVPNRKESKVELDKLPEQPNVKPKIPRQVFVSNYKLGEFQKEVASYLEKGYICSENGFNPCPTSAVNSDGTPIVVFSVFLEHYQAYDEKCRNQFC